jgi:predicted metal-dependent hydrolase
LEYQLIRSERRKTIALQVRNAQIIVRAPKFVKTAYVESLIQSKLQWLNEKVAEQQQNTLLNPSFSEQFSRDNTDQKPSIYIDGLPHSIIITYGRSDVIHDPHEQSLTVVINARYDTCDMYSEAAVLKIKSQIEAWFKARIEAYLAQNIVLFSEKMSLQ